MSTRIAWLTHSYTLDFCFSHIMVSKILKRCQKILIIRQPFYALVTGATSSLLFPCFSIIFFQKHILLYF